MSEEEKETIDHLKFVCEYSRNDIKITVNKIDVEILLKVIKKQQKKIQKLQTIDKEHQKLNEELRKEIENLQNDNMEKDLMIDGLREERRLAAEEIQEQYFVSKDKIRAKIKSLEEKIHIVIPNEYNKVEIMNEFKNEGAVDILKELLEEE